MQDDPDLAQGNSDKGGKTQKASSVKGEQTPATETEIQYFPNDLFLIVIVGLAAGPRGLPRNEKRERDKADDGGQPRAQTR